MTLIDQYLTWLETNKGRSISTSNKYRGYLSRWFDWCKKEKIKPLEASQDNLLKFSGEYAHKIGLGPRSRRPLVASLRGFYTWAYNKGEISSNPSADLPYPKAGKSLPHALTMINAEKLLMAPDLQTFLGFRDASIIALMIGCGFRISGLVSLNESSLINVESGDKERLMIRVIEKGKKERLVPVPVESQFLIIGYLGHKELESIDRKLPDGDQVLFVSTKNHRIPDHEYHGEARRLKGRGIFDMLQKYGEQVGIPKSQRNPHAMRHFYGTELAESEVDLLMRQSLMGHEDPKSTEVYTHLAARKRMNVVDKANPLSKMKNPLLNNLRNLSNEL